MVSIDYKITNDLSLRGLVGYYRPKPSTELPPSLRNNPVDLRIKGLTDKLRMSFTKNPKESFGFYEELSLARASIFIP